MSLLHIAISLTVVEGLHTRGQEGSPRPINEAYNFDQFVQDFGREYAAGSDEYSRRASIFQESLLQIHATNSRANRSWTAGVYPFMDWTGAERSQRLYGYDPSASRHLVEPAPRAIVALQAGTGTALHERVYGGSDDSFEAKAPPPRNQGSVCGSCWAFAAVEAVEAQLMKPLSAWPRDKGKPRLSAQALVDCVPNPKHCGGTGGCGGATPQLAFDFMRNTGVPLEDNVPYKHSETGKCPLDPYPPGWMRVTVTGWRQLPSNQAQPLMHAIVNDGPVAVAVDAHHWAPYHSGIYDECSKDAIPNHAVLAKGYGVGGATKYWVIQNSWGGKWGEEGSIRLARHDDEDSWCGIDSRPQEGSACDDEADQKVTVCGTCGLLYDAVIPIVGSVTVEHLAYSTDSASADAAAASLAAEANSEEGATMPRLNQQVLVDPQISYGGTIEVVSTSDDQPTPTLPTQAASPMESQRNYVSGSYESTTAAPMTSDAHAGSVTAQRTDQARHAPLQELAATHFTVSEVVDKWSSLSDDAMPSISDSAEPVAMHPAEDVAPHDKDVSSSGIVAPSLPQSIGMADMMDFGIGSDKDHTGVLQHSQVPQAGMAAQVKASGGMASSSASSFDLPELEIATSSLHTEESQPQIQSNLAVRANRDASNSGSALPGLHSNHMYGRVHDSPIDSYLRR